MNQEAGFHLVWCSVPWVATQGTHLLGAEVDTADILTERDETNNMTSRSLTVGPAGPTRIRYVALGDSYSSGEGAYSYAYCNDVVFPGQLCTDVPDENMCHRSLVAWADCQPGGLVEHAVPGLLNHEVNGQDFHFYACSGAKTVDVCPDFATPNGSCSCSNCNWQEGSQIRRPGAVTALAEADLVTITIGG